MLNLILKQIKANMPLIALLNFSVALILLRILFTGHFTFAFLIWNLILAAVPLFISTLLISFKPLRDKWFLLIPLLVTWLLFLPNAPYIITDLFHLRPRGDAPQWLDLLVILSSALSGLIMFFVSFTQIQQILKNKLNNLLYYTSNFTIILLCGFGIYLGRFLRFNSWDIISQPEPLMFDIIERFINPLAHPKTWGITIGYGLFLLLSYWAVQNIKLSSEQQYEV